jgi:glycosyltransferase involved in cell wall biosynthesis
MEISVIVPCYNCEAYVAETINSILNQTVKVNEIIVINDGSTDKSLEVLKTFGDKIVLISQENKGVCKTLNFGIRQSKSNYIAFLDSDDLWVPDKIENQILNIKDNPEYSIFAGGIRQFVSPEIKNHSYVFIEYPQNSLSKITCLVKKEVFLNDGWFKEEGSLIDFFEWIELMNSKNEKIFFSKEILAHRRIRPNSLSQSKEYYPNLLRFLKNRIDIKRQNEQTKS